MKELRAKHVALTVGLFFAAMHLLWSIVILLGLAQPLIDFIFWAHMLSNPYHVTGFTLTQAGTLIVVTFFVGYCMGWVFSVLWNTIGKRG